jgi:hypothetical protein
MVASLTRRPVPLLVARLSIKPLMTFSSSSYEMTIG